MEGPSNSVGVVVIGRNEGERLRRCLESIRDVPIRVYVDSGSMDDSVSMARALGVEVVELRSPPTFTAARARNAGLEHLLGRHAGLQFVQTIDGDCELQRGWIQSAVQTLESEPHLALAFGRRRECHPEQSIYNALCDHEWNVPIGEATGCGGDALFRIEALRSVDFYRSSMIAGEDSEMGMRLREAGWRLRRIDAEMTLHDADITRFRQWWNRARRSGHGFAEMAYLHPDARDPNWPRTVASIVAWGGALPLALLLAIFTALQGDTVGWLAAAMLLLPWGLQIVRLACSERRRGLPKRIARASGLLLMVGKFPQFLGLIRYHYHRMMQRHSPLIEYH